MFAVTGIRYTVVGLVLMVICNGASGADLAKGNDDGAVTLETVGFRTIDEPFQIKVTNASPELVYVALNPRDYRKKLGFYFLTDEDDSTVAIFSSRVFAPLPYYRPYSDLTSVEVVRLMPRESILIPVDFPTHLVESTPPLDLVIRGARSITLGDIVSATFELGYFRDSDEIREVLNGKAFCCFLSGKEKLNRGKYEGQFIAVIQEIATLTIDINKTEKSPKRAPH